MRKPIALIALLLVVPAAPAAAQSFGAAAGVAGGDVLFGQPAFDREPGSSRLSFRRGEAERTQLSGSVA